MTALPVSQKYGGALTFSDVRRAVGKVHDFVKSNRVISKVAKAAAALGVPHADSISSAAEKAGYGRRKKRRSARRKKATAVGVVRHRPVRRMRGTGAPAIVV